MEGNPWLRRHRPKINIDSAGITDISRPEQKMTPLKLQGALGTAVQRNLRK